jgi:hypothetical protein
MDPDVCILCGVPLAVNVYKVECSLYDDDSHLFQTFICVFCLMSVLVTENR